MNKQQKAERYFNALKDLIATIKMFALKAACVSDLEEAREFAYGAVRLAPFHWREDAETVMHGTREQVISVAQQAFANLSACRVDFDSLCKFRQFDQAFALFEWLVKEGQASPETLAAAQGQLNSNDALVIHRRGALQKSDRVMPADSAAPVQDGAPSPKIPEVLALLRFTFESYILFGQTDNNNPHVRVGMWHLALALASVKDEMGKLGMVGVMNEASARALLERQTTRTLPTPIALLIHHLTDSATEIQTQIRHATRHLLQAAVPGDRGVYSLTGCEHRVFIGEHIPDQFRCVACGKLSEVVRKTPSDSHSRDEEFVHLKEELAARMERGAQELIALAAWLTSMSLPDSVQAVACPLH